MQENRGSSHQKTLFKNLLSNRLDPIDTNSVTRRKTQANMVDWKNSKIIIFSNDLHCSDGGGSGRLPGWRQTHLRLTQ
jgi:hypothetical protein